MSKFKIGYTQGAFDLFHVGHLNLLNRARQLCDYLIVGVNSDRLVLEYKHKLPFVSEEERCLIVSNIKAVDKCMIVSTLDKAVLHSQFSFDAVFIGDDWKGSERWTQTEKDLQPLGVPVIYLPYTYGISSSTLRDKL